MVSTEPVNDIEATGECCCAGCIGMGPCDLDPSPCPRCWGHDCCCDDDDQDDLPEDEDC